MSARSQDKRSSILSHAEELFANFGLHGVSIRDIADEASRGIIAKTMDPIAKLFFQALMRAMPQANPSDVHWGGHYFIAALMMMMANTGRIQRLSGKYCKADRFSEQLFVNFFAAAL